MEKIEIDGWTACTVGMVISAVVGIVCGYSVLHNIAKSQEKIEKASN